MKQAITTATQPFHAGDEPLVLNFGGGVDSTAMLVGLVQRYRAGDKTARPHLIIFADTGAEIPETYENVDRVDAWLKMNDFPGVTTVSRRTEINMRVSYDTLEGACLANETLPSEAFNMGSCSCKSKHEPMDSFLFGRTRPFKLGWVKDQGFGDLRPVKLIGYDATEATTGKRKKNAEIKEELSKLVGKPGKQRETGKRYTFRYPLVEWNWGRQACEDAIHAEGLVIPRKSACFFCPNQQVCELEYMAENHPELLLRALVIEEVARLGKHGFKMIDGLWRTTRKDDDRPGNWGVWAKREGHLERAEAATGTKLADLVKAAAPHLGPDPLVKPTTEAERKEIRKAQAAKRRAAKKAATGAAEPKPALPSEPKRETTKALVQRLQAASPDAPFAWIVRQAVEAGAKANTARGALVRLKAATAAI